MSPACLESLLRLTVTGGSSLSPDFIHPPSCCRFSTLSLSATGAFRASPLPSRPARTQSRIEFVILWTGRSPSVASDLARYDAVTVGYRPESACLKRTRTSLTTCTHRRTGMRILRMIRQTGTRSRAADSALNMSTFIPFLWSMGELPNYGSLRRMAPRFRARAPSRLECQYYS